VKPTVAVITPSTGSRHLANCIDSVRRQTYDGCAHYIIADGPEATVAINEAMSKADNANARLRVLSLPANTGQGRYHGYRICAAMPLLLNEDVLFFLDDDNSYSEEHVATSLDALSRGSAEWGYSLRSLVTEGGSWIVDDNCDSLGYWRRAESFLGPSDGMTSDYANYYATFPFLVDTSCMFGTTQFLRKVVYRLLSHSKGDAAFSSYLVREHDGVGTGRFTMLYRVRSENELRTRSYFERGNAAMRRHYGSTFPWCTFRAYDALSRCLSVY